jgi:hypothetical protein
VHTIALSGAGAGFLVVAILITRFTALARMFVPSRRPTGWRGQGGPGGGTQYGARTSRYDIGPGEAGPHGAQARDQAAERRQREQARAYWEPEQEAGTLPAAGFIGDAAEPGPGAGGGPG